MITPTLRALAEKRIRPSKLEALSGCPGMALMEAAVIELYGEPEESEEATLGTNLHEYARRSVEAWKSGVEWGKAIADACNQAAADGVDGWSVTCLQRALEYVRDLIAKHDIQPENVLTEHRLDMAAVGLPRGGTSDLILIVPFKLVIVVDYKMGFVDQGDADEHDQTSAYACAAALEFQCKRVLVYINQPRAERERRFQGAVYDAEALRNAAAWIAAVLRRARGDNPAITPCYTSCVYCAALRHCPAAERFIVDTLEAIALIGNPLDANGWGEAVAAAKLAEKRGEQVKVDAKRQLQQGQAVTGFKLGTPRAMVNVPDPAKALRELEAIGVMPSELANGGALTIKAGELTADAFKTLEKASLITTKLCDAPLVADKRKGAA